MKVPVDALVKGEFHRSNERYVPSYVEFDGIRISRVNIVANVVSKYENVDANYVLLNIDDGTGQIRVKLFGEDTRFASEVVEGDFVRVIGMVRDDGDRFINGEIVKKLENPNWKSLWENDVKSLVGLYKQMSSQASTRMEKEKASDAGAGSDNAKDSNEDEIEEVDI